MSPSHIHVPSHCRTVTEILSRVGDKWSVQVVVQMGEGPKRFNELRRIRDRDLAAHADPDPARPGA